MSAYVELPPRPESDKLAETDHVEDVGSVSGEDDNDSVDTIVVSTMNEQKH